MSKKSKLSLNEKNLTRRYLIWCYKTTKESLDRVDRYFTQLDVDHFVLEHIQPSKLKKPSQGYQTLVKEFEAYIGKKESNVLKQKFSDNKHTTLNPEYQYLQNRMAAIEKAIAHFLGKEELKKIRMLYEEEMTKRILQAREHA